MFFFDATLKIEEPIDIYPYWKQMMALKVRPDVLTYNLVIDNCKKNEDLRGVMEFYNLLLQEKFPPDVVTNNIVLSAVGRLGESQLLAKFWNSVRLSGMVNQFTVNIYLDINCRRVAQNIEEFLETFYKLNDEGLLDTYSLNIGLNTLSRAGRFSEMLEMYEKLRKNSKTRPDEQTFTLIIQHLCNVEMYSEALATWNKFRSQGYNISFYLVVDAFNLKSKKQVVNEDTGG